MTRFFNTAGPVRCESHYCLPPISRLNLDEVLNLIDQQKYFVLHAPRQTGKTSCLQALMEYLNQRENYRCLYVNFEVDQGCRELAYLSQIGMPQETARYFRDKGTLDIFL